MSQLVACDEFDGNCVDGAEDCPCYDNGTCDEGLDCGGGVCGDPFASNASRDVSSPRNSSPSSGGFTAASSGPNSGIFGNTITPIAADKPMVAPTREQTDVICGPSRCQDPAATIPIPGLLPAACCVDPIAGLCGLQDGQGGCAPQPEDDARCPGLTTGFGIHGASCCIEATNECGLILPPPFGNDACQSLTQAGAQASAFGGLLAFPVPVDCDDGSGEPGDDADAG